MTQEERILKQNEYDELGIEESALTTEFDALIGTKNPKRNGEIHIRQSEIRKRRKILFMELTKFD